MSHLLDEQYLTWLYNQVDSVRPQPPTRSYWGLIKHLYTKEFVWIIPNDDNRAADGMAIRQEFISSTTIEAPLEWLSLGSSVLEVMIALSRRLSFIAGREPREWFWEMLDNLTIAGWNDAVYTPEEVDEILDRFIFRGYTFDGKGGLFPLTLAEHDQTHVEIWFQMHQYLYEQGY